MVPTSPFPDRRFALGAAVAVTGVSEIVFQVTVLVSFQVIYGYLFYRIGVMVAAFMAGLATGSFWLSRYLGPELTPARAWNRFLWVHVGILVYPVLLPLVFTVRPPSVIHMFLPALAGLLGGLEFPLAVRLWREHSADAARRTANSAEHGVATWWGQRRGPDFAKSAEHAKDAKTKKNLGALGGLGGSSDAGRAAGVLYGLDLFGACVGAGLVSPFLIPVLGVAGICWWIVLLNAGTLLLLCLWSPRERGC